MYLRLDVDDARARILDRPGRGELNQRVGAELQAVSRDRPDHPNPLAGLAVERALRGRREQRQHRGERLLTAMADIAGMSLTPGVDRRGELPPGSSLAVPGDQAMIEAAFGPRLVGARRGGSPIKSQSVLLGP